MLLTHAELAPIACVNVYTGVPSFTLPGDVVVAILDYPDEFVVAFRGTNPLNARDWIRDFSFWPVNDPLIGWAHSGFVSAAREASPKLAFPSNPRKMITVTCHSLGAAEGICVAGMHVAKGRPNPIRFVGFGCPRIFPIWNFKIAGLVAQMAGAHLYANAGDPVPHVPLAPIYLHRVPQTTLGEPLFALDPIRNHFGALYVERMAALNS